MKCPVCKSQELVSKDNSYFCPKCKIYASVTNDKQSNLQNKEDESFTSDFFSDTPTPQQQFSIRNLLITVVVSSLLVSSYFILTNLNSYIDVEKFCLIKIESSEARGNRQSIIDAIGEIKKSNKSLYKELCQYIDTIAESNCQNAEPHINLEEAGLAEKKGGCFVKGSKTIYLTPVKTYSSELVKNRVETLEKDILLSSEYQKSIGNQ